VRDIGKRMSRYILGSEKMFYDFINSISKKDKIGLITHIDLDGIASGIFLQKILESRGLKVQFIEFVNYNPGALKNAIDDKEYDVLFFTDWNADNYLEELEDVRSKSRFLVIDHHPPNEALKDKSNFIKTESNYCSAHTLFDLAKSGKYFYTKKFEWLVCSAIILDYTWDKNSANFEFIKSIYPEVKQDSSIWNSEPGEIGKAIANAPIYYSSDLMKVYDLVLNKDLTSLKKADKVIRKEIEKWIEKFKKEAEYFEEQKLYFAYGNPKYNIVSVVANKLSDEYFGESTVIFVSDIRDKKGFVKLSSRNQTGKVDLNKLLRKCVEGLENANAGGHFKASAGVIMKKDLEKFKERLLIELKQFQ
jgi:single-stranded DNA-specific DHH superfamily exonuclease